ncbi:uncharacterized protein LOC111832099 [Capsella rubella]|uniref:uncharacterized protein LOC111832099 n=1 Tax=Capsella rubella TaxID=81985 RepID=UPI000CD52085|nr:uncharacterized protein LOC111832099 [Capsella rubella]
MSPPKETLTTGDTHLSGQFGPHPRSTIAEEDLVHVKFLCGLTSETELIAPGDDLSPEDPRLATAAPTRSSSRTSLDRGLLSETFADYFVTFCSGQTAWDSFTCPRIREAGARIRTRFLTISSPQPAPPKMNYREERAYKKKMELKEKELQKKMVAMLSGIKAQVPSKEKSSSPAAPPEGSGREVITLPDSELSADSPAPRPAPEEGQASGSKKRKATESGLPARSQTNAPFSPHSPAKILADMMRSFSCPGARVPAFQDMSVNNREDYFRFAEKVGEMLFEFNSSVAHYKEQLFASPSATEIGVLQARISDLEKEVKKLKSAEASIRAEVEKTVKFNKRLRTVEGDLQIVESSLDTCQDKLQIVGELYLKATTAKTEAKQELQEIKLWNQLLEAGNSSEMERVRREERRKTRAELRSTIDKIGAQLVEHDRLIPHAIQAAEITANRMLVEEIDRGEIAALKEELETFKADEETARLEAEKVKDLTFDPASFTALLADTPPELGPDPAPATLMIE